MPAKKMIIEAFKDDISKKGKKARQKIQNKLYESIKSIRNKLGNKGSKIYSKMKTKAKSIKNKEMKKRVTSLLEKKRLKNLFKSSVFGLVTNKITNIASQMIKYDALDCWTSIGGFIAGVVDIEVDGCLSDKTIYF